MACLAGRVVASLVSGLTGFGMDGADQELAMIGRNK